jgi:dCMP deaminase
MTKDVLNWDEYFMSVAFLSSMRSVDRNHRAGACIVNQENRIVGIGYCGLPRAMDSVGTGSEDTDDLKLYLCHSVMNAILNKNQYDVRGCRIYCTHFPCNECAKMILQSGISRVTYSSGNGDQEASKLLFTLAGVSVCPYSPRIRTHVTVFALEGGIDPGIAANAARDPAKSD